MLKAPWRPFPRSAPSGRTTRLPRPPWFVTNKQHHRIGERLTRFEHRPGWLALPGVFFYALQG